MLRTEKIRFVGFDLDQTLYQDTPAMKKQFRSTIYRLLAKELNISEEKAAQEFEKNYKVLGSGTESARVLGVKEPEYFSALVSSQANIEVFLEKDQHLIDLIQALKERYVLFLATASAKDSGIRKLEKLGLSLADFKYSIFNDSTGAGKTTGKSFLKIMKSTKARPEEHVFVGDRDATDILPAKRLGLQTVMVWNKSEHADLSIDSIYDLGDYL